MDVGDAYRRCEAITRFRAANFYYGIRLLPGRKRQALCAVYAFARRVDDIGDGNLSPDEQLARLDRAREGLAAARNGNDPVLIALADAANRFPIPLGAFGDLIDGVEMDVRGTSYRTFEEVLVYCRRVAGSIGRLSLGVFGAADLTAARPLADDLGVAMQLTNILRDIREDLARGRVYLPREDLRRFGCGPDLRGPPDGLAALIRFEAHRAAGWFERGSALLPLLDGRSAACVGAMTGIYRRILRRINHRPESVLGGRVSLASWEKAWVAARSLARAGA